MRVSGPDAASAWMRVTQHHLYMSEFYAGLSALDARVQVEIARRRWAGKTRDSTAVVGAVHGFIASGQYDSAAVWAARDPSLQQIGQFASARARGTAFSFPVAGTRELDSGNSDGLLLSLWSRAGDEVVEAQVRRVGSPKAASNPIAPFLMAFAARDTSAVVTTLVQVEKHLAAPAGIEGSVLERFGDPIVYWVMGQAHAFLALSAGSRALALSDAGGASLAHLYRGRAFYALREIGPAEVEFKAVTHPDDVGQACAYMAGIAIQRGETKPAQDRAQQCASAALAKGDGPALVTLAHVQSGLGIGVWPTTESATKMLEKLIKKHQVTPQSSMDPYWVLALLSARTALDSSKQMYLAAGNGKLPHPNEGLTELFCIDYLTTSVRRGLEMSFAPDLQFGFHGLWKFIEIVPATRSLVEGLRWLMIDLYPEEGGKQQ